MVAGKKREIRIFAKERKSVIVGYLRRIKERGYNNFYEDFP